MNISYFIIYEFDKILIKKYIKIVKKSQYFNVLDMNK